ncbi:MAG: hypothetical protein MUF36_09880 [Bacteroidales bacterium]|nr:hypothetical protein [Bacteroidales bacterium]
MKYSQFLKILSAFMVFIMLIQIAGCYTMRSITGEIKYSDLPDPEKYVYVIHMKTAVLWLENTIVSEDSLSGTICSKQHLDIDYRVHIFLSSDSVVRINNNLFCVNLKDIVKAKQTIHNKAAQTFSIVAGGIVGVAGGIVLFIYLLKWLGENSCWGCY